MHHWRKSVQILLNIIEDVWLFVIGVIGEGYTYVLNDENSGIPSGSFGEGFDRCSMCCDVIIVAEPTSD